VPKTLQVRNVPDEVHAALRRRADESGVSLSEYVLREILANATKPANADVFSRLAPLRVDIGVDEILDAVHADRR
jgi:plasmid stability protein